MLAYFVKGERVLAKQYHDSDFEEAIVTSAPLFKEPSGKYSVKVLFTDGRIGTIFGRSDIKYIGPAHEVY